MKAYVKPELYFEDFELTTHIAGCIGAITNPVGMSCGTEDDLTSLENGLYSVTGAVADPEEEYCYTGANASNMFS